MTPKEKAREVYDMFSGAHVILCRSKKGAPQRPYSSDYVMKSVMHTQSIEMGIKHIEYIMEIIAKIDKKHLSNNGYLFYYSTGEDQYHFWKETKEELLKINE